MERDCFFGRYRFPEAVFLKRDGCGQLFPDHPGQLDSKDSVSIDFLRWFPLRFYPQSSFSSWQDYSFHVFGVRFYVLFPRGIPALIPLFSKMVRLLHPRLRSSLESRNSLPPLPISGNAGVPVLLRRSALKLSFSAGGSTALGFFLFLFN